MTKTRGGAPQEYAGAEPEPELRFMNLKVIWSLFEAQRCTSKHPLRGFETRWKYILPGRDPNGTEGVDYVLGEQAVWRGRKRWKDCVPHKRLKWRELLKLQIKRLLRPTGLRESTSKSPAKSSASKSSERKSKSAARAPAASPDPRGASPARASPACATSARASPSRQLLVRRQASHVQYSH
ncbi:hypothetical protein PC116_g19109 [Phytophthora cactorum]|nr:hypothetical protein PC112_g19256 [Phytophthora cactorum]KAG2806255.1 hypothetical protein PC111_g17449 [Phytophthora cactorum]KAG2861044.1 hypothetical protein PC113_g7532 [Phytophthora cactorum]KAG2893130.1 hypothetical protein PC114_g16367 [Phytophthora cactorum]KAG3002041.1 hypothetical protein PC119_g16497 [Phytophthora cactorum]